MAILSLSYKCFHPAEYNGRPYTTDRKIWKELSRQLCPECQAKRNQIQSPCDEQQSPEKDKVIPTGY